MKLGASLILILCLAGTHASGAPQWPVAEVADAEAFLAHVGTIAQALEKAGHAIEVPRDKSPNAAAAAQSALDSHCLGCLRLGGAGPGEFIPAPHRPRLVEQGWRPLLLKVINPDRVTGTLRVDSPNADPLPNAPKDAVAARWLELEADSRTPFSPNLSGAPLEYRILTLWARDPGQAKAEMEFNVAPAVGEGAASSRRWDFNDGADGWSARHDCRIEAREGALDITNSGNDPAIFATVNLPAGEKLVRFRAKNAATPGWQLYWSTTDNPNPDGRRVRNLTVFQDNADWSEYSVTFRAGQPLAGLRIDPGSGPGRCAIDWVEVISLMDPAPASARAAVEFEVDRSREVKFAVRDENGQPCTAAFVIRDDRARIYPLMSKRLAPDFFFQKQVYRADGENVRLPAGRYEVTCSRGPESVPETKTLVVADDSGGANDGAPAPMVDYKVRRWIDPAQKGWFSGDHHIHAAGCAHYTNPVEGVHPPDMQRHIMGEDLKVGCNLTWGPCFDYQKQFFTGRIDEASRYPYLLRYDIEVSGFGSHQSGHLCLLRLKEQIIPGGDSKNHWPTLGLNTLKWAKAQGAVCGPAHSGSGLDGNEGRVAEPDGPDGLPSYVVPHLDGIGACEYVVDIAHEVPGPDGRPVPAVDFISTMDTNRRSELNMWYHTLNCGFRVRASGETDFPCITGERVGDGRVYVKQSGKLEFDEWCDGIRDGRSYVSDGSAHIIDFAAHGVPVGERGSEARLDKPGTVRLTAHVAARRGDRREVPVEAIVNGWPVAREVITADGTARDLSIEVPVSQSSWVALRIFPHVHTNPVFVVVDGKPIRASRRSAQWFRRCVDQCWKVKEKTYAEAEKEQARQAYDHARATYDRLIAESAVE